MKIFRSEQIRHIDEFTIRNEPVSSVDLMERAAGKIRDWFTACFSNEKPVFIFTGPGNNGGDGLALARMLYKDNYKTNVFFVQVSDNTSPDWKINKERLIRETDVPFSIITDPNRCLSYPKV